MIQDFLHFSLAESEQVSRFLLDLHEIPQTEVEIPNVSNISTSYSTSDPRLRSVSYKQALYHISAVKKLRQRGFEVPEMQIVLDLDKTMVHCVQVRNADNQIALQEAMKRIKSETKVKDLATVSYFLDSSKHNWVVAIRPGLNDFLRKASHLGQLHICTQAEPTYAREVVKAIDPTRSFFGERVYSQLAPSEKSLRNMFDGDYDRLKDLVVIVDDQPCVWAIEDQPNVLQSYRFSPLSKFDTSLLQPDLNRQNTMYYIAKNMPPLRNDFCQFTERPGQLESFLRVLRHLHKRLFVEPIPVSLLLQDLRQNLLLNQMFSLSTLQEPWREEKKLVFSYIIQALGGTAVEDPTNARAVDESVLKTWFLLSPISC